MPDEKRYDVEVVVKTEQRFTQGAVTGLVWVERGTFAFIGVLLFAVAITVLIRSAAMMGHLVTVPPDQAVGAASVLLDSILFVLILVELAYTVVLSLRGATLSAEPFLIVGLIAVIRRILVITVGEVDHASGAAPSASLFPSGVIELLVLTAVVVAFVFAIWLMRRIPGRPTRAEPIP